MATLFGKTKHLEAKIDEFLSHASEVGLLFLEGIRNYLEGRAEEFEARCAQVTELEKHADDLRHEIERQLYLETLIPESRGDVLGILEHTDEVINSAKATLTQFSVEAPDIPDDLDADYLELADFGSRAVQELVSGIRSFFRSGSSVSDYTHKVSFWEKEADQVGEKLRRRIFEHDLDLSQKIHLSNFVQHIDAVADEAEDVSERLAISAIKRSI
jgi:predicted phosphate transport protein (TIGR00153 family)